MVTTYLAKESISDLSKLNAMDFLETNLSSGNKGMMINFIITQFGLTSPKMLKMEAVSTKSTRSQEFTTLYLRNRKV